MFQSFFEILFLSDLGYLPLHFAIILVCNWDALGKEAVSLGVHQAICRNSENIEP